MNKKRFYMFLSVLLVLLIGSVYLLIIRATDTPQKINHVDSRIDVDLFYYRTVPGFQRAEELDMVAPIIKSYNINSMDSRLVLDKIWYTNKYVYIFYHVENTLDPVLLGGNLYVHDGEKTENCTLGIYDNIWKQDEKGIIYEGSFYSFLKLPPVENYNKDKPIEFIFFEPYVLLDVSDKMIYRFEPVRIHLDYNEEDELIEKIPIDAYIDIHDSKFDVYQLDIGTTYNRIYFQYLNKNRNPIYKIKGSFRTNKGESFDIDTTPMIITDYPYHYYINLPPMNFKPDNAILEIQDLYCISNESISLNIITDDYNKRKGESIVNNVIDSIGITNIILDKIMFSDEYAKISIIYEFGKSEDTSIHKLHMENPILINNANYIKNMNMLRYDLANILSIYNGNKSYDNFHNNYVSWSLEAADSITILLAREYWDKSDNILIDIDNLTYKISPQKEIRLDLNN